MDSVNGLLHWDDKVDHAEVILQAVPNEDAAAVDEEPEFLVGRLQGGEVLGRKVGVKVARFDPRELGQIVHHLRAPVKYFYLDPGRADLLLGGDVIINEGHPLHSTLSAHTGYPVLAETLRHWISPQLIHCS